MAGLGSLPEDYGRPLFSDEARNRILSDVRTALDQTVGYLLATAACDRTDRLWPGEQELYSTNPMSLAYGACGPALLLHELDRLPVEVSDWLLNRDLSAEDYPPGMYVGLGGIAYALQRLGCEDRADDAMVQLYRSRLKFEAPHVMLGAAGWGLCSLHRFTRTGDRDHMVWALRAAEFVIDSAERRMDLLCWPVRSEERVHYGYGYGSSGIALFMLHLHLLTGDATAKEVAVRALEFDLAHEEANEWGPTWRRWEEDPTIRPYWIHGAAGIGAVVIRFHQALGSPRYLEIARRIAESLFIKFTVTPGQFEGMAGIAEFLLDMYAATGEERYRDRAVDLAETILWFQLRRPRGVAWPGVSLDKVSSDFSCGAAGVGLFFVRLLDSRPRLTFELDHCLSER
ncbi:lanthionine synthetase C family protein [Streptomyces sp. NPDC090798]|uniref:lanthionine synthetase C family protein n=1 Tax=Streptomyces sp. NPDC090798 TaxID=3365968 RepID=UPI0037F49537